MQNTKNSEIVFEKFIKYFKNYQSEQAEPVRLMLHEKRADVIFFRARADKKLNDKFLADAKLIIKNCAFPLTATMHTTWFTYSARLTTIAIRFVDVPAQIFSLNNIYSPNKLLAL